MTTIADKLEDFGFSATSYQNNINGSRISAYSQRPFASNIQAGSLPVLYVGWKTFPSAPTVREVNWNEILRKNQKIRISSIFRTLTPLVLNNNKIKTLVSNFFLKASLQFNHSNTLEFQNILVSISNGNIRSTTTGDVYSFDFESIYRILAIKEDYGYMIICKDIEFDFVNPEIVDYQRMILISTSLLTFVDLVELM